MVVDQLPRLGKRELICLLLFTCNYVVSVWRGFLFLWVLGMGYVLLLWHSLSLPYNYLLPTVRIRPHNLFSASSVDLHGASNTNVLRKILRVKYPQSSHQFYVNILILSKDLVCILAFLSAMPRVATVVNIHVQILLLLHI